MHFIYAHLIGDYLFQSDWMAAGKKKSDLICAVHAGVYMLPFLFCGLVWWQMALIMVQHFAQDRTGFIIWLMKIKGSGEFAKPPMAPWSIIITDNIVHVLFIALVVSL